MERCAVPAAAGRCDRPTRHCSRGPARRRPAARTGRCSAPSRRNNCCARKHNWSAGRPARRPARPTRPPERYRRSPPSAWPGAALCAGRTFCAVTADAARIPVRRLAAARRPPPPRRRRRQPPRRRCGATSAPGVRAAPGRHRRRLAVDGAVHATGKAPRQRHAGRAPQRLADQGVAPEALAQLRIARQALQQELGFRARQLTVEKCRDLLTNLFAHVSSGRPRPPSKMGRSFLSIASRARKIRERTVPTGQSIVCAISS